MLDPLSSSYCCKVPATVHKSTPYPENKQVRTAAGVQKHPQRSRLQRGSLRLCQFPSGHQEARFKCPERLRVQKQLIQKRFPSLPPNQKMWNSGKHTKETTQQTPPLPSSTLKGRATCQRDSLLKQPVPTASVAPFPAQGWVGEQNQDKSEACQVRCT